MIHTLLFLLWPPLMWGCQGFVMWKRADLVGKGRILTRPLWRIPFFRPEPLYWPGESEPFHVSYGGVRVKQLVVLVAPLVFELVAIFTRGLVIPALAPCIDLVIICLYLDDYITGDDDAWRRSKEGARNAVKWLMELPRTQTEDV